MKFLDGFKTLIGLVGTVVAVVLPRVAPGVVQAVGEAAVQVATGAFAMLAALGLIHKGEKARNK